MYSAATINNAFEQDLNGLIGSFDSTVSFSAYQIILGGGAFTLCLLGIFFGRACYIFWLFYFDCCKYAFPD
jgi:hypothetical protein